MPPMLPNKKNICLLKTIQTQLKNNNLIITSGNKDNSIVIPTEEHYERKNNAIVDK